MKTFVIGVNQKVELNQNLDSEMKEALEKNEILHVAQKFLAVDITVGGGALPGTDMMANNYSAEITPGEDEIKIYCNHFEGMVLGIIKTECMSESQKKVTQRVRQLIIINLSNLVVRSQRELQKCEGW